MDSLKFEVKISKADGKPILFPEIVQDFWQEALQSVASAMVRDGNMIASVEPIEN